VYDNYSNKTLTLAYKEGMSYSNKEKGLFIFSSEREMLQFYLAWYKENIPDVVTGWNVIRFDMNYLYYRLTRLFDRDFVNGVISPFGWVGKTNIRGRFGALEEVVSIKGVFLVDYLTLYRKYSPQMRENYRLDYIAEIELEDREDLASSIEKKKETAGKVRELYLEDFKNFLKYNRDDVILVRELDRKFKFINLIDYIRRFSRTLFDDYDFTSAIVDGYMLCEAKRQEIALPSAMKDQHGTFPGAFVLEPTSMGLKKWIVSYDLNSLYPNIIKTINISPETKVGIREDREAWQAESDGIPYAIAGNDTVFWTDREGFIPAAISKLVDLRNQNKAKAQELKKQNRPYESYDKLQAALKVIANGTYGYLSFRKSRFFDIDMAGAVTMTGQKLIKKIIEVINEYMRKSYSLEEDVVLASDTDSIYVHMGPVVEKLGTWGKRNDTQKLAIINKLAKEIQDKINGELVGEFAREECNVEKHYFGIKREIIGKSGFWTRKKRYAIWVIDDEGKKVDKMKKVGLEIVRSNMSRPIKKKIEDIIWLILKKKGNAEVNVKVKELLKSVREMSIDEVAIPIGVSKPLSEYNKNVPMHIRGTLWYNNYAEKHGLQKIGQGAKILYLPIVKERSRNALGERIHVIAFPPGECPIDETLLRKILNWKKLEERNVFGPLEPIFEGMNWKLPGKKIKKSLKDFI
jgi:DNA polymerase elongation subunit (family B)